MTELELYRDTLASPDVLNTAHKLAAQICHTEFVPKGLRGSPEKVLAALLLGREKGVGAMTALTHIDVIEGRAGANAALKQALAESAGARFKVREMSDQRCVIHAWSPGDTGDPTVIVWSMDDAKKAGIAGKNVWRQYPRKMLFRRAMSEAVDVVAASAVCGLPPTLEDIEDDYAAAAPPAPNEPKRTVQRKPPAPAPAPTVQQAMPSFDDDEPVEAELVDDEPAIPQLIPTGDMATEKQVKMALALCSGMKLDDKGRHDMVYGSSNGRTEHIRELTKTEISKLIDELKGVPAGGGNNLRPDEEPF
jgi:hypothetical protein